MYIFIYTHKQHEYNILIKSLWSMVIISTILTFTWTVALPVTDEEDSIHRRNWPSEHVVSTLNMKLLVVRDLERSTHAPQTLRFNVLSPPSPENNWALLEQTWCRRGLRAGNKQTTFLFRRPCSCHLLKVSRMLNRIRCFKLMTLYEQGVRR